MGGGGGGQTNHSPHTLPSSLSKLVHMEIKLPFVLLSSFRVVKMVTHRCLLFLTSFLFSLSLSLFFFFAVPVCELSLSACQLLWRGTVSGGRNVKVPSAPFSRASKVLSVKL